MTRARTVANVATNFPEGAWTSYTPTFSNLTLGNGTIDFDYIQIGKTVHVRGTLTWGTTTSATASGVFFSAPVAALTATGSPIVGHARFNDIGTNNYSGNVTLSGAGTFGLVAINTAGSFAALSTVNNTIPMTWASTDQILIYATYEAA
jgi:hypothetical protein